MKNFKQQAALNRALSIIQAIDDERFHWMMSDCHYSHKIKGFYELTIWTENEETAILLRNQIMEHVIQDGDSIETRKCDSKDTPYTITVKIEY